MTLIRNFPKIVFWFIVLAPAAYAFTKYGLFTYAALESEQGFYGSMMRPGSLIWLAGWLSFGLIKFGFDIFRFESAGKLPWIVKRFPQAALENNLTYKRLISKNGKENVKSELLRVVGHSDKHFDLEAHGWSDKPENEFGDVAD